MKETKKGKGEDRRIKALKAGKRISKRGKLYYEYRTNRSDERGMMSGRTIYRKKKAKTKTKTKRRR